MVDLMGNQAHNGILEDGDPTLTVDLLVFDRDGARSGNHAAHVKEAPAALVLLVGLG